jgi:hypothetical protein
LLSFEVSFDVGDVVLCLHAELYAVLLLRARGLWLRFRAAADERLLEHMYLYYAHVLCSAIPLLYGAPAGVWLVVEVKHGFSPVTVCTLLTLLCSAMPLLIAAPAGVRLVVEVKRGFSPELVLNQLYKNTRLQLRFASNMVSVSPQRPAIQLCGLWCAVGVRLNPVTAKTREGQGQATAQPCMRIAPLLCTHQVLFKLQQSMKHPSLLSQPAHLPAR